MENTYGFYLLSLYKFICIHVFNNLDEKHASKSNQILCYFEHLGTKIWKIIFNVKILNKLVLYYFD